MEEVTADMWVWGSARRQSKEDNGRKMTGENHHRDNSCRTIAAGEGQKEGGAGAGGLGQRESSEVGKEGSY